MGALDNYANHEGMNIYITPLEKVDEIKNFRINQIRKFVENHRTDSGVKRAIADVFEDVYYKELYK